MADLKRSTAALLALTMLATSCGKLTTATRVDYLETDTYISSSDPANHAELPYLRVSKSSDLEERAIVKLPTGKSDLDQNLDEQLKDPLAWMFFPFILYMDILADIFDCGGQPLEPSLLQSAKLYVDVTKNPESDLSGKITLNLLAKPWWQSVNWERAHPFSERGLWSEPGGDVDPSFAPIASGVDGSSVTFDITAYFKQIITESNPTHFGLLLEAASPSLGQVELASTQFNGTFQRPRVISVYQCPTGAVAAKRVFILGSSRGSAK